MNPLNLAIALVLTILAIGYFVRWAAQDEPAFFWVAWFAALAAGLNLWAGLA